MSETTSLQQTNKLPKPAPENFYTLIKLWQADRKKYLSRLMKDSTFAVESTQDIFEGLGAWGSVISQTASLLKEYLRQSISSGNPEAIQIFCTIAYTLDCPVNAWLQELGSDYRFEKAHVKEVQSEICSEAERTT